jgi:hypothetical protein
MRTLLRVVGAVLLGLVMLVWSGYQLAASNPKLEALCNVGGLGSNCTFTNQGDDAASGCATVTMLNRANSQSVTSATICSGEIQPNATGQAVPLQFIHGDPGVLCAEPDPGGIPANCTMHIEIDRVRVNDSIGSLLSRFFLQFCVIISSAVWVFFDTKKLRIQSPGQWIIGTLLLWIIGFPWYLVEREKHLAAQRAGQATA